MRIFAVKGNRKTGKTTVINCLIKELCRRKLKVATIKNSHCLDLDPFLPNSDTDKQLKAGAVCSGLHNSQGTVFLPGSFDPCAQDFLILEGFRDLAIPHIITGRCLQDISLNMAGQRLAVLGPVWSGAFALNKLTRLDYFQDIGALADILMAKLPQINDLALAELLERVYSYERSQSKELESLCAPLKTGSGIFQPRTKAKGELCSGIS